MLPHLLLERDEVVGSLHVEDGVGLDNEFLEGT